MNQLQKTFWESEHDFRTYAHPVVEHFSAQRINFLRKFISPDEIGSVLDAGAGAGFSSFYLQGVCRNLVAADSSMRMLSRNPVRKKALADIHHLPFKDNCFDMVCAWEVLHHLDNPEAAAGEIIRVSKKYICVFEVNRNNPAQFLFGLMNKEHRGAMKFSKRYLLRLFNKKAGIIKHATAGVIFPNRTPVWMFYLLRRLPFTMPLCGISNFILCEKI
jgi:ubiquinone/menaquinone biosynthesis C-methylase UbiE